MYIKDHINEFISSLNGRIDQPEYSIILAALFKNYAVFHIEIGFDDGVPYAELGIAAPHDIVLNLRTIAYPENIWEDVSFNKSELVKGIPVAAICDYCNTNLFPIVTIDPTIPEEISRELILGIAEDETEDGRSIVLFDVNDSNNDTLNLDTLDLHELIIRCSYDPAKYKELSFDDPGIKEWSTKNYAGLYLTYWMMKQQRLVVATDEIE